MECRIIEAVSTQGNWGRFMLGRFDAEWEYVSHIGNEDGQRYRILPGRWSPDSLLVLDLVTGEGTILTPGGLVSADLRKHQIWVCPLYEPFCEWLYEADRSDLSKLPELVELGDVPLALSGYRRPGPEFGPIIDRLNEENEALRTQATRIIERLAETHCFVARDKAVREFLAYYTD